ncbi:hypothetical protein BLA6992_07444 [Burkholderia lata]|nr:hypothetical protein BLA6992_07444 [Burkholderia lata]
MKRICHECIGEQYLSNEINAADDIDLCSYCGETAASTTVGILADRIETAFKDHFIRTSEAPSEMEERWMANKDSSYVWMRDGCPVIDVIANEAQIPKATANDVLAILEGRHAGFEKEHMGEESEFASTSCYEARGADDRAWQAEWLAFASSLKSEARFFSQTAATYLAEVFGAIDQDKTRGDRATVIVAGPGTEIEHLYRARVFQNDGQLQEALCRPDLHLGPPPSKLAKAGRMNAQGISAFYGATNSTVALAEVRPPVGSKIAIARFLIARHLRLLDLTALEDVHVQGSIFDPSLKGQLERSVFLQRLQSRMTRPVMPDDEAFDYLPTQAIADFLATMNDPRLDGIVYRSAQTKGGNNVVLFHHAAKVSELSLPDGTKTSANIGNESSDGWEDDYFVLDSYVTKTTSDEGASDNELRIMSRHPRVSPLWGADLRGATLAVDVECVAVHYVNSARIETTEHEVPRYQSEVRMRKY